MFWIFSISYYPSKDFDRQKWISDKEKRYELSEEIIESETRALVCGHNPVLPGVVAKFIGKKSFKELDHGLMPGESWILHHREGEIVAIDWMPAPEN